MVEKVKYMFRGEAASGIFLVSAAMLALIIANSPLSTGYNNFLELPVVFSFASFEINKPLLLWVNDGLMAIFFFLVGLEIKRELVKGHLSDMKQLVLPFVAAIAGIVAPALIYYFFNAQNEVAVAGWAIPSATDIAFALGIFVIFGRHLPLSLKLFLLTVAIFDDIAAVLIIAIFYSQDLSTNSMLVAAAGLVALTLLNRFNIQLRTPYLLIGLIVWAAVLKSGVHATLAGFAIAWFIPLTTEKGNKISMLEDIEHSLHSWVAFFILPLFAFANAGVQIVGASLDSIFNSVTIGIALGLFVGKQIGIFGVCWLVVKLKLAKLPKATSWLQLYGVSLLCGVGFTMSLFIGSLAFENNGMHLQDSVKIGVLFGSILSATLGAWVISLVNSKIAVTHQKNINTQASKNELEALHNT